MMIDCQQVSFATVWFPRPLLGNFSAHWRLPIADLANNWSQRAKRFLFCTFYLFLGYLSVQICSLMSHSSSLQEKDLLLDWLVKPLPYWPRWPLLPGVCIEPFSRFLFIVARAIHRIHPPTARSKASVSAILIAAAGGTC